MRTVLGFVLLAGLLAACEESPNSTTESTPSATAPDNTANNRRDRDTSAPTPIDQGNSAADTEITAQVRRSIMDDSTMSTNAQNCKIVTQNGVVTLRGVVESQAEKDAIGAKASAVAGVVSVDNQLEVKAP